MEERFLSAAAQALLKLLQANDIEFSDSDSVKCIAEGSPDGGAVHGEVRHVSSRAGNARPQRGQ